MVQLTNEMIQGAKRTEQNTGVPASITLAQIILESSGSNEGGLSDLAYKGNNLFGVKSFSKNDNKIYMRNSEGVYAWKKYDSISESIADHEKIITLDRYKSRYNNATSVYDYALALQNGGYAGTSLNYANQLMSIINSNNLNQYNIGSFDTTEGSSPIITTPTKKEETEKLTILGNVLKYIAIMMMTIIGIFFFIKSLGIEVI